jgi:hypothetical protein
MCVKEPDIYVDYRLIHYPVVEENRRTRRKTTRNGFEVDPSAYSKDFHSNWDSNLSS